MSGLLPCKRSPVIRCPARFRVGASQWIDETNFGDLPAGRAPPAGIRLRWNWPLEGHPSGVPAYPDVFKVLRTRALDPNKMFDPRPNVGHLPRMLAPPRLWRSLHRESDHEFVVEGASCSSVHAISIAMSPHGRAVSIALLDTVGRTLLVGELNPGDSFYYELANLHRVSFSAVPYLDRIDGLHLDPITAETLDLHFEEIASIDARAWLRATLGEVAERMSDEGRPAFVSISDQDWMELIDRARPMFEALDQQAPVPALERAYVELTLAQRWEVAALAGTAFLDGAHVAMPQFDRIDAASMLAAAADAVYGYRIVAEFATAGLHAVGSDIALTLARPMTMLTPASVTPRTFPRSRLVRVNQIDQVAPPVIPAHQPPMPNGQPVPRVVCTTRWTIESRAPLAERISSTPQASPSDITGEGYDEAPEHYSSDGEQPRLFRGFEVIERRDHSFNIPFYDCDIWLSLAVGDCWDRRIAQPPTPRIQPDIDYDGPCLALDSGRSDPSAGTVTLALQSDPQWVADPLATYARGRIEVLLKDPASDALEAHVVLFAPSAVQDGNWSAEIETDIDANALHYFVGGTLALDGFKARVLGFGPVRRGRYRCDFEAVSVCAGADLYDAGPHGIGARLYEKDGSDRVWDLIGAIPLNTDGTPGSRAATFELPQLETSANLYFSTRLAFEFEGHSYSGPVTPKVAVPYIHPAPAPPEQCVAIEALAVDYYGRTLVRVAATDCERFDTGLNVRLDLADGVIDDREHFGTGATPGMFGAQAAFGHRVLFEGFDLLTARAEGELVTLGMRYVRASDGRESPPILQPFVKRRID